MALEHKEDTLASDLDKTIQSINEQLNHLDIKDLKIIEKVAKMMAKR